MLQQTALLILGRPLDFAKIQGVTDVVTLALRNPQ
jgi:hypothetical protein